MSGTTAIGLLGIGLGLYAMFKGETGVGVLVICIGVGFMAMKDKR